MTPVVGSGAQVYAPASHDSTLASTDPPAARLSSLAVGAAAAPLDAGGLRRVSRDDYVRGAPIAQGGT